MLLVMKLTLAPALVVAASVAAQRFGPGVAGLIAGFPIVGGPIFLFLVLERGETFGVDAAAGTLLGLVAWAAFSICYSRVCRLYGWFVSMLSASVAFLFTALLLSRWQPGLTLSFLAGIAVPVLTPVLLPAVRRSDAKAPLPRIEIFIRMAAAGALVLAITEVAEIGGPTLAGLLTAFPVATGVLTMFSQRLSGADAAIEILSGSAAGLYGFVVFFVVAALTLDYGILVSCVAAVAAALIAQTAVYRLKATAASSS